MATFQYFAYCDSSTVANFKAWAQPISNALATFGWVKTSDTGQVSWSTLSSVPAFGAVTVYEVWAMGDTLQATMPVYLKIIYTQSSSSSGYELVLQVGTSTNGAGTLTGATFTATNNGVTSSQGTTTAYECDLSGSTNRLSMGIFRSSSYPSFFSIERSHDASGNDTGTYVSCLYASNLVSSNGIQQILLPVSSGGVLPSEKYGLTFQTTGTSGALAQSVAVAPFFPMVGKVDYPMLGAVLFKANDFPDGAQFQTTIYGATHNYLAMTNLTTVRGVLWGNNSNTNNCVAIRFD